jgi:hypothetical protein
MMEDIWNWTDNGPLRHYAKSDILETGSWVLLSLLVGLVVTIVYTAYNKIHHG